MSDLFERLKKAVASESSGDILKGNNHTKKLRVLLEALELEHIDELMSEDIPKEVFQQIGQVITQFAKLGAEVTVEMEKLMKSGEIVPPVNPN